MKQVRLTLDHAARHIIWYSYRRKYYSDWNRYDI